MRPALCSVATVFGFASSNAVCNASVLPNIKPSHLVLQAKSGLLTMLTSTSKPARPIPNDKYIRTGREGFIVFETRVEQTQQHILF
jgi:hypothetical protein